MDTEYFTYNVICLLNLYVIRYTNHYVMQTCKDQDANANARLDTRHARRLRRRRKSFRRFIRGRKLVWWWWVWTWLKFTLWWTGVKELCIIQSSIVDCYNIFCDDNNFWIVCRLETRQPSLQFSERWTCRKLRASLALTGFEERTLGAIGCHKNFDHINTTNVYQVYIAGQ